MDTWSLPKARPISCNDCPAFQRDHMSVRWFAESFTRLPCVINTTFREKIYSRWCCNDPLSWHCFSECGKAQSCSWASFLEAGLLGIWSTGRASERQSVDEDQSCG